MFNVKDFGAIGDGVAIAYPFSKRSMLVKIFFPLWVLILSVVLAPLLLASRIDK
jgi:hypothetical protein